MCIKEGLYFRDEIAEKYYCKLSYSGEKPNCKYLGSTDESLLHVCDYDLDKSKKGGKK